MLPDRVSNPGPLTYESGALPIALRGPAMTDDVQRLTTVAAPEFFAELFSFVIFSIEVVSTL